MNRARATGGWIELCEDCALKRMSFDDAGEPFEAELHCCEACLGQAAAAITDGWQPIQTAPKDGTEVLLAFPAGRLAQAWYCDNGEAPEMWVVGSILMQALAMMGDAGAMPGTMGVGVDPRGAFAPTHWMPLPEAPEAGA